MELVCSVVFLCYIYILMCCDKFVGMQSGTPMHVPGVPGAFNPVFAHSVRSAAAAAMSNSIASGPSGVSSENHTVPPSLPSMSAAIRDMSSLSEEQITRLHDDILYVLQNEGQSGVDEQENIVDDSLFENDEGESAEVQDGAVPTATGDVEMCGAGVETGGVTFEYLKSLIEKIKTEIADFKQPACYRNGTFWHRLRDAVFALEASWLTPSGINPRELYHRDVFIWLLGLPTRLPGEPEVLHCPACLKKDGKHNYLIRKGLLIELGISMFLIQYHRL